MKKLIYQNKFNINKQVLITIQTDIEWQENKNKVHNFILNNKFRKNNHTERFKFLSKYNMKEKNLF